MKLITNPDKFIFFIGVAIVGFLFIFSYILLKHLVILIPLLILWILFSIYLIKRNYIIYIIQDDKFVIHFMRKKYVINFDEIVYIIEFSNYTNILKQKKYELRLNDKFNIADKLLKIENKTFTKWMLKHHDKFRIQKRMFYD